MPGVPVRPVSQKPMLNCCGRRSAARQGTVGKALAADGRWRVGQPARQVGLRTAGLAAPLANPEPVLRRVCVARPPTPSRHLFWAARLFTFCRYIFFRRWASVVAGLRAARLGFLDMFVDPPR